MHHSEKVLLGSTPTRGLSVWSLFLPNFLWVVTHQNTVHAFYVHTLAIVLDQGHGWSVKAGPQALHCGCSQLLSRQDGSNAGATLTRGDNKMYNVTPLGVIKNRLNHIFSLFLLLAEYKKHKLTSKRTT